MNIEQVSLNKVLMFLSQFNFIASLVQVKFKQVHSNLKINNITSSKKLNLEVK